MRSVKLSIIYIFGQTLADVDMGQAGHTAPEEYVAWWRISRSVQIASEPGQPEQVDQAIIGKGFLLPVFNKLGAF
jgi:hypothetical protein